VSGLAAACTAAGQTDVVLLEASSTLGGRVQSDWTKDGFCLDRGFAVFVEEYPNSKALLDYDALDLHPFDPGALVKLPNKAKLARVADPLRQPKRLLAALLSPVGKLRDKLRLAPLLIHVFTTPIEEFFQEEETDTFTCLKERWKFSDDFISEFLEPFLEGIFLAPLTQQSSRMFHFVFQMFSIGSVSLPRNGMGAVADQLAEKARSVGVDVRTNHPITAIRQLDNGDFEVRIQGASSLVAQKVILATDVSRTQTLLSTLEGYESIANENDKPVERSVGCLYYSFKGDPPVKDPILILNGLPTRGTAQSPINNACFPSVVCDNYAPPGQHLCSVSILSPVLDAFSGQHDKLDQAVRNQLSEWFPSHNIQEWKLEGICEIPNAQPAQFGATYPANVNEGRDCTTFRGHKLPKGLIVAGDHMATSSLNGALGSGIQAGKVATEGMP